MIALLAASVFFAIISALVVLCVLLLMKPKRLKLQVKFWPVPGFDLEADSADEQDSSDKSKS